MQKVSELVVFGEGSAAVVKAYLISCQRVLIDRKFRLAVQRVQHRITAMQRMRKGAAPRRKWESIRQAQVEREEQEQLTASAGASFMGKIWYRMGRRLAAGES